MSHFFKLNNFKHFSFINTKDNTIAWKQNNTIKFYNVQDMMLLDSVKYKYQNTTQIKTWIFIIQRMSYLCKWMEKYICMCLHFGFLSKVSHLKTI